MTLTPDTVGALEFKVADLSLADLLVDLNLAEIDRDVEDLRAVEHALGRIRRGTYGMPPDTPWTREELREAIQGGAELVRRSLGQFVHMDYSDGSSRLFAAGEEFHLDADLSQVAPILTGPAPLTAETLQPLLENRDALALLTELANEGFLSVEGA